MPAHRRFAECSATSYAAVTRHLQLAMPPTAGFLEETFSLEKPLWRDYRSLRKTSQLRYDCRTAKPGSPADRSRHAKQHDCRASTELLE